MSKSMRCGNGKLGGDYPDSKRRGKGRSLWFEDDWSGG